MRKAADYRKHAEECRLLASKTGPGDHRDQLVKMAQTWDALAAEREREIKIHDSIERTQNTESEAAGAPDTATPAGDA